MPTLLTGRARLCVVGVLVGWQACLDCPTLQSSPPTPYSVLMSPSRRGGLLGTVLGRRSVARTAQGACGLRRGRQAIEASGWGESGGVLGLALGDCVRGPPQPVRGCLVSPLATISVIMLTRYAAGSATEAKMQVPACSSGSDRCGRAVSFYV